MGDELGVLVDGLLIAIPLVLLVGLAIVGLGTLLLWAEVIHQTGMSCFRCLGVRGCTECGGGVNECHDCRGVAVCEACSQKPVNS